MAKWTTTGYTVYDYISAPGERFKSAFVRPSFMTNLDVGLLQSVINQLGSLREIATLVSPEADISDKLTAISTYITAWSTDRKSLFERVHDLYSKEYNPLENFDRYESASDTSSNIASGETMTEARNDSNGTSASNNTARTTAKNDGITESVNASDSTADNATSGNGTNASNSTSKIMPIDGSSDADLQTTGGGSSFGNSENASSSASRTTSTSDGYAANKQNSESESVTDANEGHDQHDRTASASTNSTEASASAEHIGHLHGNIGVTTSQQMLEAESKLRRAYGSDLRYIAECFLADCTLQSWNF